MRRTALVWVTGFGLVMAGTVLAPGNARALASGTSTVLPASLTVSVIGAQKGVRQSNPLTASEWSASWALALRLPESFVGKSVDLTFVWASGQDWAPLSYVVGADATVKVTFGNPAVASVARAQAQVAGLVTPVAVKVTEMPGGVPTRVDIKSWKAQPVRLIVDVKVSRLGDAYVLTGRTITAGGKPAGGVRVLPVQFLGSTWRMFEDDAGTSSRTGRFRLTTTQLLPGQVGVGTTCNPGCLLTYSKPVSLR